MTTQLSNNQRVKTTLFGFVVKRRGPHGKVELKFLWTRILIALVTLGLFCWLALAVFLFCYFRYWKEYPEVEFSHMLFWFVPSKLAKHRRTMGSYDIAKASAHLEKGEYGYALAYAKAGVARSPSNLKGRIILASFYSHPHFGRPELAIQVIRDGLPYAQNDLGYMRFFCEWLLLYQHDDEVRKLADQYLPKTPVLTPYNRYLALAAAKANYFRGKFDRAEAYLEDYLLSQTSEGMALAVKINWERGLKDLAFVHLKTALHRFPQSDQFYSLICSYYRELEDYKNALKYAVLWNTTAPLDAIPRLEIIYNHYLEGNTEKQKEAIESFIDQFGNDKKAIQSLAQFSTEIGEVDLTRRLYEHALENDLEVSYFAMHFIEANIVRKNYEAAIQFTEELLREDPAWREVEAPDFYSLRSLAYFGVGNEELGEFYLQKFFRLNDVRAEIYLAVSNRFEKVGPQSKAWEVLRHAYEQDSSNQAVLNKLIALDLQLGNSQHLSQYLHKLLQMRRVSRELLEEAYHQLGSDRFIFTSDRESLLVDLATALHKNKSSSPASP